MRRREFIGLLGSTVIAWPGCSRADGSGRVWRVGIVGRGPGDESERELVRRLGDLGYAQDKNIVFVHQFAEASPQGFENAILSIIPNIDLLIVSGTLGGVAAKKLMVTKPVVFVSVGAPVEIGLVESLSRPGGNMTGITFEAATETYAKRLQILKEIVPKVNRVAVLQAQGDANVKFAMASLEGAAPNLGIQLSPIPIGSSSDIAAAFDEMRQSQSEALIVIAGLLTYRNGQQIADLTLAHHLPSCHAFRETVAMGGLVSLGPDILAIWRQAAGYIDQIIRGSQPRELPVQQPTRYELAINLKTAKALGLTLPPSLLAGADVVIE
jgi:putative tryptophan/tyrosine transport system substrate-binding protein